MKLFLSSQLYFALPFYSVDGMKRKIITIKWSTLLLYQDQINGRFSPLLHPGTLLQYLRSSVQSMSHFPALYIVECRLTWCLWALPALFVIDNKPFEYVWNAWHVQNLNVILDGRLVIQFGLYYMYSVHFNISWLHTISMLEHVHAYILIKHFGLFNRLDAFEQNHPRLTQ